MLRRTTKDGGPRTDAHYGGKMVKWTKKLLGSM